MAKPRLIPEQRDILRCPDQQLQVTACPGSGKTTTLVAVTERWIADGNAVKEGLEKAGYKVDLQFANDDIPTQSQQIDQMITNGADILVIAAIDGTALSS